MKYLYVLASDDSDYYLEQTLLSITSLRLYMPDAFVTLLVDDVTEANLTGKRAEILKLITELKSVKIDGRFSKKARSRWLKTSMRQIIEGDFLYIDGDTIIAEDLCAINTLNVELGAVPDNHIHLPEYVEYQPARLKQMMKRYKKLGFISCFDLDMHFNGGIFFCRDCKTAHNFFEEWHRLWLHCFELGNLTDQQSLNQSNFILGDVIKELDGIWNCQLMYDGALKYFHDAKIIHYFATHVHKKFFLLANREYTERIKETGIVDQETKDMLKNPKSHIASNTRIMLVDKSLREFYDSAICGAAKRIYYTKLGSAIEFVFSIIKKYIFTPLRKKLFMHR
ncbi:MAG: hypothetical protein FWF55_10070 [Treponema sp.]|nr:hypothetical protein [Treponema sp.]